MVEWKRNARYVDMYVSEKSYNMRILMEEEY